MRNWEALSIALFIRCTCWSAARLASAPYYTEAVAALRRHPLACDALGPPLRFKALNLGSKENWVTEERAHVREEGLQLPESAQHAGTYFPVADHYFTTCIKVKWGEGVQTLDGTCMRDPNMNLIIQYGLLGLVLGLGLGLGFILYCRIWRPWHYRTCAHSRSNSMGFPNTGPHFICTQ